MRLTRLLYPYEAVIYSLYTCMIENKISECYFWTGELFYSGEDMKMIFMKYHKDFCSYVPFYFEEDYDTLDSILLLMLNLYEIKPNLNMYFFRTAEEIFPTHRYNVKRDSLFETGIKKKKPMNIAFYMNYYIEDHGFEKAKEKALCKQANTKEELLEDIFERIYITPPNNLIYMVDDLDEEVLKIEKRYISKTPYRILKNREYKINDKIGCFNIETPAHEDVLLHWEFYTQGTPFWDKLWKEYKVVFKEKKPIFENDDSLELFYELYGYELDEQSKEIQEKSLFDIEKISIREWMKQII